MFSTLTKPILNFSFTFILSSANTFNLDQSKIFLYGKEGLPSCQYSPIKCLWSYHREKPMGVKGDRFGHVWLYRTFMCLYSLSWKDSQRLNNQRLTGTQQHALSLLQVFSDFPLKLQYCKHCVRTLSLGFTFADTTPTVSDNDVGTQLGYFYRIMKHEIGV